MHYVPLVPPPSLPEASNHYIRATFLSLDRFYSQPQKRFHRAKKLEPLWGLDRRVLARAWGMLQGTGIMSHRTAAGGANGHGGHVWEVDPDQAQALAFLFEALPYHAGAAVYGALGYAEPPVPVAA